MLGPLSRPIERTPQEQFRYSFPLEDETAPKHLLDQVLATTILVPVQELIAVAPEVCKQLKDLCIDGKVYPCFC